MEARGEPISPAASVLAPAAGAMEQRRSDRRPPGRRCDASSAAQANRGCERPPRESFAFGSRRCYLASALAAKTNRRAENFWSRTNSDIAFQCVAVLWDGIRAVSSIWIFWEPAMSASISRRQITVAVRPEQYEQIVREAEVERRPVASLVRNILDDALRDRGERRAEAR